MWFFCALLAAILWGLQYTLFGRYFPAVNPLSFYWIASVCGTLCVSLLMIFTRTPWPTYSTWQWESLPLQIFCGVGANLLCFIAIQQKNASLASFVEICYPIFIVLFSWILFREIQLTPMQMGGGVLIIAGLFFISH